MNSPAPTADSQEVSVLAPHLLQSWLVFVNTLLLQRILPDQPIDLTVEDRRALSPLSWTHVRPYGTFQLHLDQHLDLDPPIRPAYLPADALTCARRRAAKLEPMLGR